MVNQKTFTTTAFAKEEGNTVTTTPTTFFSNLTLYLVLGTGFWIHTNREEANELSIACSLHATQSNYLNLNERPRTTGQHPKFAQKLKLETGDVDHHIPLRLG